VTVSADTQITELAVNDHACLTFGEAEELLDLTAAFVRDGLDGGLVAAALGGTTVSVLCQYDRERFDPVTLASVAAFHTRSVAAATYYAGVMLRICRQYAPPGIRLAGELDYQASEFLALALTEAIRLDGDVTVNMAPLAFADVCCARMILDAARGLNPKTPNTPKNPKSPPRRMILRCRPGLAARFVLLGAADIPTLSLVSVDDQ